MQPGLGFQRGVQGLVLESFGPVSLWPTAAGASSEIGFSCGSLIDAKILVLGSIFVAREKLRQGILDRHRRLLLTELKARNCFRNMGVSQTTLFFMSSKTEISV